MDEKYLCNDFGRCVSAPASGHKPGPTPKGETEMLPLDLCEDIPIQGIFTLWNCSIGVFSLEMESMQHLPLSSPA